MKHYIRIEEQDRMKIYCNGILMIEGKSYNWVISTLRKSIKVIHDDYQKSLIEAILNSIDIEEVVVNG